MSSRDEAGWTRGRTDANAPDVLTVIIRSRDRFEHIGNAAGIIKDDEIYFWEHPGETERYRIVTADDVEAPPETTHVRVFEHIDFNGSRTGYRHRMFLRYAEWHW